MLTNQQLQDVAQVHLIAEEFAADIVIIGAAALLWFIDLGRFTRDIDLVIALELEQFAMFSVRLNSRGWIQDRAREHRWRGPADQSLTLFLLVRIFVPESNSSGRKASLQ